MTPEDKLLFVCTRQSFLGTHRQAVFDLCSNTVIQWESVYRAAREHGVGPLVYANLLQCGDLAASIPAAVMDQFEQCFYENIVLKGEAAENLADVLYRFNQASIEVMLIKEAALDILVYQQPWYTASSGIDLIVRRTRGELARAVIDRIIGPRSAIHLEYDFFKHHDVAMNGVLPVNFQEVWDAASRISFKGQEVYVMSPEDPLISTCINSCRKRYFHLKAVCDIAETANTYRDLNWDEFARKARDYHCNNIVFTALLVTSTIVGCELPEGVLNHLSVHPGRAALIRHFLQWSQHVPLSALSAYTGRTLFGRKLGLSLVLPYATYPPEQVGRKMREVFRARRSHNAT